MLSDCNVEHFQGAAIGPYRHNSSYMVQSNGGRDQMISLRI